MLFCVYRTALPKLDRVPVWVLCQLQAPGFPQKGQKVTFLGVPRETGFWGFETPMSGLVHLLFGKNEENLSLIRESGVDFRPQNPQKRRF